MKYDGTYDSDFDVRLATLAKLGGDVTKSYDSVYEIDLAILDAIQGGGGGGAVIDDNDVSTGKCWSSSKIVSELADAGFDVEIVQELPETGDAHTIYFVPNGGSTGNVYDEWMYINNTWECVGNTAIDLSGYAKIADVDASLANYATIANVDSSLANKADKSELANYATITNVDSSLALKADKTQLADYATIANVDASLANYATITNVDSSLALKADKTQLADYATITNVDASLANYATIANVDSSLALKADKTQLADYATIANVDASLANYATITNVDASLANYATIANVDASLANYATITNVDSSLALKQDVLTAGTNITIQNNVISATGGGGGASIVELTQSEYDALSTASKTDGTLYSITDATIANMNNYYTKSEANAAFNPIATVSQSTSGYKFPKWNAHGQITGTSATAYQANQSINGSSRTIYSSSSSALATIYAPTSAGTSGQYLVSSGSGAPVWQDLEVASDYVIADSDASTGTYSSSIAAFYTKTISENTTQGVQIKMTDSQTIYEVDNLTTLSTLSDGDLFGVKLGQTATIVVDDNGTSHSVSIAVDGTITDSDATGCVVKINHATTQDYTAYEFQTNSTYTFTSATGDLYETTTSSQSFDSYYLPSSSRIYNDIVELWLMTTENGATWENRHYIITSNSISLDVTNGTFGS